MSDEVECSICGKTFGGNSALQQHTRAVHPEVSTQGGTWEKAKYPVYGLGAGVLILGGLMVVYTWVWPWMNAPELPGQDDHWHARYRIEICGETLSPFPYSEGDVHTHGNGRIHVHPHSAETAGKNANLSAFMESLGGTLSDTSLSLPVRGTYTNGDECPGGSVGEVTVEANGERVSDPDAYVPQDGDRIRIAFESRS